MKNRIKLALLRWLLAPSGEIRRHHGRTYLGDEAKIVVTDTPPNVETFGHDAVRAFHCGRHTVFFYGDCREMPSWPGKPL